MRKGHLLSLAAVLVVIPARDMLVLVPAMAHGAPAQMSVCVAKLELALVNTSSGQRYRAVTTFSGHPTFTFYDDPTRLVGGIAAQFDQTRLVPPR